MNEITPGILIHGCNLGAYQWERIVWGDPKHNQLGRITRALLTMLEYEYALKTQVAVLVLGTGVVWTGKGKRSDRSGCMEAHETRKLMFERLSTLKEFKVFHDRFPAVTDDAFIEQLRSRLERITELATDCQNTTEEVINAARIFEARRVNRAILVSSPVHLPRCLKEACIALGSDDWEFVRHGLHGAPSDTNYQNTKTEDTVIFEKPHRPDRSKYPTHEFVKRIANISDERMEAFLEDLDALLTEYGA